VQVVTSAILFLRSLLRSERGQDLLEYALLGGLIAAAILAAFSLAAFSGALDSMATNIADCVDFEAGTDCNITMP
jgi:Flp pilus assembly pilin Flp